MNLASQEAELIGSWRIEGKHVVADATCRRIEQLIKDQLRKLAAIQSLPIRFVANEVIRC